MEKECYITIKGEKINVTEDVYYEYKRPEWRERKRRIIRSDKERSLERLIAGGFDIASDQMSVEDIVEYKMLLEALYAALDELADDEHEFIDALFFQGRTERAVAKETTLSKSGVHKKKGNILNKLKIYLKNW